MNRKTYLNVKLIVKFFFFFLFFEEISFLLFKYIIKKKVLSNK